MVYKFFFLLVHWTFLNIHLNCYACIYAYVSICFLLSILWLISSMPFDLCHLPVLETQVVFNFLVLHKFFRFSIGPLWGLFFHEFSRMEFWGLKFYILTWVNSPRWLLSSLPCLHHASQPTLGILWLSHFWQCKGGHRVISFSLIFVSWSCCSNLCW